MTTTIPGPADNHTNATARHAKLIELALAGVPVSGQDTRFLGWMASWDGPTVERFCELIGRVRTAGWTAPVLAYADQVRPGWQVLDARDETTWHLVAEARECPVDHDDPTLADEGCVVFVSAAYADGEAHWGADSTHTVRIPAGDR